MRLIIEVLKACRWPRWLRSWQSVWMGLDRFTRYMVIGVLASIVVSHAREISILDKIETETFDWVMRLYVRSTPSDSSALRPITFIDIDERTYRLWGEPLHVPRDRLLAILKYSVDGGASIIVVDVELSKFSGAADDALADYLNQLANRSANQPPLVLLSRGIRMADPTAGKPVFEIRDSFLDDKLIGNRIVHWAAPLFQIDEDFVIRRWKLWQPVCVGGHEKRPGIGVGLASFQLLAVSGIRGIGADSELALNHLDHMKELLGAHASTACSGRVSTTLPKIELAGRSIDLEASGISERIIYTLPYRLKEHEAYPRIDWLGDSGYPLLSIKPAFLITEKVNEAIVDKPLQGHAVFIGASFLDSRDSYLTPIGMMPGTLIVANSYLSLLNHGPTMDMPGIYMWPMRLISVLVMAWIFSRVRGFRAKFLANVAVLIVLVPASIIFFRLGIWLDFAVPLVVIDLYSHYDEVENIAMERSNEK